MAETPTPKLPKSRLPKTDPTNRLSNGTDTAAPSTLGHATDGNKGQLLNQARQRQQQLNQSNTTETQKLSERANDRADADTSADKKQKAPIPKVPGSAASVMEKAGQNIADRHRQKRAEAGKEGDSAGMKAVKQVGKDMASVAQGMAEGAAQGGLPGAVKGGLQKAVKTKTFWIKLAAILTPFFLLIGMVGGVIGMIVTSVSAGDTDTAQEATSRDSISDDIGESVTEAYDGRDSGQRMLQRVAESSGADFYVLSSLYEQYGNTTTTDDDETTWFGLSEDGVDDLKDSDIELEDDQWDIEDEARFVADLLSASQREHFPSGASMDLAQGYTPAVALGGREPINGQEEVRQQTLDRWIESVEALPIQDAEENAHHIADRARNWKIGKTEQVCTPDGGSGDSGGAPAEYQPLIEDAASESGVPAEVLTAQLDQESGFDPDATSPANAMGIAQFMPGTWQEYGDGGDVFDPEDAIPAQGRYMKDMMDQVSDMSGGDDQEQLKLALAAYNAGPGNVEKHDGIPPFGETQDYVENITGAVGEVEFSVNCSAVDGAGGGMSVDGVGEDDYPYREPVGQKGWSFPRTAFGHTQRECTDFVMWRINQAMGWSPSSSEPPPFTFEQLGVGYGDGQSGAGSWADILTEVDGIEMADTPQPGDIAWWGYSDIGGGFGHVGFVADVADSEVTIEHYNYSNPSEYSSTVHQADEVPGYIRINSLDDHDDS